jgi:hypothetical protein
MPSRREFNHPATVRGLVRSKHQTGGLQVVSPGGLRGARTLEGTQDVGAARHDASMHDVVPGKGWGGGAGTGCVSDRLVRRRHREQTPGTASRWRVAVQNHVWRTGTTCAHVHTQGASLKPGTYAGSAQLYRGGGQRVSVVPSRVVSRTQKSGPSSREPWSPSMKMKVSGNRSRSRGVPGRHTRT